MQGIIFNALEEFVLETANMEVWNSILASSNLKSGGIYTSGVNYEDSEIVSLATSLCEKLGIPLVDGLKLFGKYLFGFLLNRGPIELASYPNTQALLENLETVVHKDVKRIHPDAYTPFFVYTPINENEGELSYSSKRKLCFVAEGLLEGAAEHYGQSVQMTHFECMHDGAKSCKWKVTFS
jgi:hypothetical protein